MGTVLLTARLHLVTVERRHLEGLRALWTDPRVMANVGFPAGLHPDDLHLDQYLGGASAPPGRRPGVHLAVEAGDGTFLGEAKLPAPDADGTSEPDVKLLPAAWGQGFGTEIVSALLAETWRRWPACRRVRFTPHVTNLAARALYARLGAVDVGEGYDPPGTHRLRGFAGVRYRILEIARPSLRE